MYRAIFFKLQLMTNQGIIKSNVKQLLLMLNTVEEHKTKIFKYILENWFKYFGETFTLVLDLSFYMYIFSLLWGFSLNSFGKPPCIKNNSHFKKISLFFCFWIMALIFLKNGGVDLAFHLLFI